MKTLLQPARMKRQIFLQLALAITVIASSAMHALAAADVAANFKVAGTNAEISSADYRGKVIYVDFWASWCAPCLKSFPWMNDMQQKYAADGLQIIAINMDKDRALSVEFLEKTGAGFPIGYDPNGKLAAQFEVVGMPSSYLIDRDGKLISSHVGWRTKDIEKYEAAIAAALAKQ